jgi:stage V sporulation protein R
MMGAMSHTSTRMLREGRQLAPELVTARDEIAALARSYGLDFYEVVFELVDHDELNMLASYGGFPTRYPHWRFGMEYEHLQKSYAYGLRRSTSSSSTTTPATRT